jgi:adenine/guanine phosphoribosyltransferase-like PRPP-binding protein
MSREEPALDRRRRCKATAERFQQALVATNRAPTGREYSPDRYSAALPVEGLSVLLIDDTWATGGHAQSAGAALRAAGAARIGLVAVGRHVQPGWRPVADGPTSLQILDSLPKAFDWSVCSAPECAAVTAQPDQA